MVRTQSARPLCRARRRSRCAAAALVAATAAGLVTAASAPAQTAWVRPPATAGDWFTASNWSLGVPPSYFTATIGNGGTAQITGGSALAAEVRIGAAAGATGAGTLAQSGGTLNVQTWGFYVGYAGTGAYQLGDTAALSTGTFVDEFVGYNGAGTVTQTGGTNTASSNLVVGHAAVGTYNQSGGTVSVGRDLSLGDATGGSGTYAQSGGQNTVGMNLKLGVAAGASGTYQLSAGTLAVTTFSTTVGGAGNGHFVQTGGSVDLSHAGPLYVSGSAGGSGSYELHDGTVNANSLQITGAGTFAQSGGTMTDLYPYVGRGALYDQTGGAHASNYLNVTTGGRYHLAGTGVLNIDSVANTGTFDFTGGGGTLNYTGIADFSTGTVLNAAGAAATGGPTSLLIVPAGANPSSFFGSFSTTGFTHVVGTALNLGAGQTISGTGTIADHVYTAGTLSGPSLSGGVTVSGGGVTGPALTVRDSDSGISAGSLSETAQSIGSGAATGTFTQSGGTNAAGFVVIGTGSRYALGGGGSLQVTYGLVNNGTFDASAGATGGSLTAGGITDISAGQLLSPENIDVTVPANAVLTVPAGFDPATRFRSFSNSGIVHTAGTRLTIPQGTSVTTVGNVVDPVTVYGTLAQFVNVTAPLNLTNGVNVPAGGVVDNSFVGTVTVNDATSGVSGGTLNTYTLNIGTTRDGATFTYTAGSLSAIQTYVGSGAAGSLVINGGGASGDRISLSSLYVGHASAGSVLQSGGSIYSTVYIGENAGVSGTYHLTGGTLSAAPYVGYAGTGEFIQDGGSVSGGCTIGWLHGSVGTYRLNNGSGPTSGVEIGVAGTGAFVQSGGTLGSDTSQPLVYIGGSRGVGTYNMSGGSANVSIAYVGEGGEGALHQSGGTWSAKNETIGFQGTGTMQQSGGSHAVSQLLKIDKGSLTLSGGTLSAGSLQMTSNARLAFVLDPASPLNTIAVSGAGTLGGLLDVDVPDGTSDPFNTLGSFVLLSSGSTIGGSFSNVASGSRLVTPDGSFLVSYGAGSAFDPKQLVISDFQAASPVPEPAAAALLFAVGPLLARRRRRRRK